MLGSKSQLPSPSPFRNPKSFLQFKAATLLPKKNSPAAFLLEGYPDSNFSKDWKELFPRRFLIVPDHQILHSACTADFFALLDAFFWSDKWSDFFVYLWTALFLIRTTSTMISVKWYPALSCWFCIALTYWNVVRCAFQQTCAIFIKFKICQCIRGFFAG